MAEVHVFADESGNFDFQRGRGTRYFLVCSVTMADYTLGDDLMALRRELCWREPSLHRGFHATEDRQDVRNQVFRLLSEHDFRVDATILDKYKTFERLRADEARFYKTAFYHHMKHVVPRITTDSDDFFFTAASMGTNKKRRELLERELRDVIAQVSSCRSINVALVSAMSEPCLQVADYCSWAIFRKWEQKDERSYSLIADKIRSEFDLFRYGKELT